MQKRTSFLRRCIAVLLTTVSLLASSAAQGGEYTYLEEEKQTDFAVACLTEVYGYLAEETEMFVYEQTSQDGIATLRFWPEAQPEWVYTCTFSLTDGERLSAESPFASINPAYPGENSVRYFLRALVDKQLLTKWDKAAREAFRNLLAQEDITPNAALDKGLYSANYAPQRALLDFFITCYDEPALWPKAVGQWYDQLLEEHGLEKPQAQPLEANVTRYRIEEKPSYVLTEFALQTPPELAEAFAQPMLEGWEVFTGAFVAYGEEAKPLRKQGNTGLVVFTKGEERLLCALSMAEEEWHIEPVSTTVLPAGTMPVIVRSEPLSTGRSGRYQITFDGENYQNVSILVDMERQEEGHLLCKLSRYSFTDAKTGDRYKFAPSDGSLVITRNMAETGLTEKRAMLLPFETVLTYIGPWAVPALSMELFEDPAKSEMYYLPEDMVITGNVHLRQETSSRSKDLGTLKAGTIARKLDTEPGDPYPWYHVEIGGMTGYVAGNYVDDLPGVYADACLPIALSLKEAGLKENTGLFAAETEKIPAFCTMHVIMQEGDWLYVSVPQNQPAGMRMDPEGSFGWIHSSDVKLGATALGLEWEQGIAPSGQ